MRWLKPLLFLLCLAPLGWLLWRGWQGDLGANPIETITLTTGRWTLRFLTLTLFVSPLRRITGISSLIRVRRMLGLFAFFYGFLHFSTYFAIDKFFNFSEIVQDVAKRPFITAGVVAFLSMVPLAVTSTAGWIRRLGGRRWQLLHRLIYLSACAGVVHFYWKVKSDIRQPVLYGSIVGLLLLYRLAQKRFKTTPRGVSAT
jgi:sulfoxide reductase heme-binding subunit YedZ